MNFREIDFRKVFAAIVLLLVLMLGAFYLWNHVPFWLKKKRPLLEVVITNNPENYKMMYLSFPVSDHIFDTLRIDSIPLTTGSFTFSGKISSAVKINLSVIPKYTIGTAYEHTTTLYLEPDETVKCKIDLANPGDAIVKGGPENEAFIKVGHLANMYFAQTDQSSNAIFRRVADSLSSDSPFVLIEILSGLALVSIDNLDYVEQRFSELPFIIKLSPEGLRLSRIISHLKNTGHPPVFMNNFILRDKENTIVSRDSMVGVGKGISIFYFWVPEGEYTKFGDYQKNDFEKLRSLYNALPKGSINIITVCATDKADKLAKWYKMLSDADFADRENWMNLKYNIDPITHEVQNLYDLLGLEGKLPVTLLVRPYGSAQKSWEGELSYKDIGEMKQIAEWFNKYVPADK